MNSFAAFFNLDRKKSAQNYAQIYFAFYEYCLYYSKSFEISRENPIFYREIKRINANKGKQECF